MSHTSFSTAWSRISLTSTLRSGYGATSDSGLSDTLRFVRGVADLARTRYYVRGETSSEQPIVFLLHPKNPPVGVSDREQSKRIPMLSDGHHSIAGKLWFVNHVVNEGVSVALESGEDEADVFTLVREGLHLGDVPAVTISLRQGQFLAHFFPHGLTAMSECQTSDLSKADLTLDELHAVLDGIYDAELCTPEAQGHVGTTWKDAENLVPIREAELMVQRIIKVALTGKYLGVFNILQEQSGPSGRYDLMIEQPDPIDRTVTTKHALLELKVLRDKSCTGSPVPDSKNVKAISKGLKQAVVYRDKRQVRSAALCCFDMRKDVRGSSMFDEIRAKAREKNVRLWSWHLFRSSELYREHVYSEPSAEGSTGACG